MSRLELFNAIEFKLTHLATRLEVRGGLNILDLHLHSENFYLHFFNLLFGLKLENLNTVSRNAAGVDLIDTTNDIIIQVSATATKTKIESALSKDLSAYVNYSFKFISISKDAGKLRDKTYKNPHNLTFSPKEDIYDIRSLLEKIRVMDISKEEEIYAFLERELKIEPAPEKMESNLTAVINILSKEDWGRDAEPETIPYDLEEKITYNQLDEAKTLIEDYKVHYPRIDKIYSTFDQCGANKSLSVLNGIRTEYASLTSTTSADQRFFCIIEKVIRRILTSSNYTPLPKEELELCVQILVVDAFVRCKIFKNPEGNINAGS